MRKFIKLLYSLNPFRLVKKFISKKKYIYILTKKLF